MVITLSLRFFLIFIYTTKERDVKSESGCAYLFERGV